MSKNIIHGFPQLSFNEDKTVISGVLMLDDTDEYDIEIKLRGFPKGVPAVYETDGRIPRKADRHTYDDGRLCLTTDTNMEIYLKTLIKTIENFISFLIVPYLQNNSYYEINREYKFDEYEHGSLISTYETYIDILGVKNIPQLIKIVEQRIKVRPNEKCYCGSNTKIKNCTDHYVRYKKFRLISRAQLEKDIVSLKKLLQELLQYRKGHKLLN